MQNNPSFSHGAALQQANAQMITHYEPWINLVLHVTFGREWDLLLQPSYDQARAQVRHLGAALNCAVWGNRGKFNDKCEILYIASVEGIAPEERIHAHILLGNVKTHSFVDAFMRDYIPKAKWLLPRYQLDKVYYLEGLASYMTKQVRRINPDAIDWVNARIPRPFMPH